ncbi:HNH endonuclease [Oculatella sp. FACHB-28]|nr:HNH endonuclease [Oculatella sp. FACHB-28]
MDFVSIQPTLEDYWRSIILFGKNSATYKFSLAKTLLEIAPVGKSFVSWEELAEPFSRNITEHLKVAEKQGTSNSSEFLDACRKFNVGKVSKDELINATVKLGFTNVISAFHVVGSSPLNAKFFEGDRKTDSGITLTDNLYKMLGSCQCESLPQEVEARWRLVETAWGLDLSRNLVSVEYAPDTTGLVVPQSLQLRRVTVTSCRDALNGYQKGKCFYCFQDISVEPASPNLADVDHFLPFVLAKERVLSGLDGVWNLVLACQKCNRGSNGKFDQTPHIRYLNRLHKRNEFLINSHHPLRETLMAQTGMNPIKRHNRLQTIYSKARQSLIHEWKADYEEYPPAF